MQDEGVQRAVQVLEQMLALEPDNDRVHFTLGALYDEAKQKDKTIEEMRRKRPRRVVLRYADGREEQRTHTGSPEELLQSIDHRDLVDLEVRPVGLDEVVRAVLGSEEAP